LVSGTSVQRIIICYIIYLRLSVPLRFSVRPPVMHANYLPYTYKNNILASTTLSYTVWSRPGSSCYCYNYYNAPALKSFLLYYIVTGVRGPVNWKMRLARELIGGMRCEGTITYVIIVVVYHSTTVIKTYMAGLSAEIILYRWINTIDREHSLSLVWFNKKNTLKYNIPFVKN